MLNSAIQHVTGRHVFLKEFKYEGIAACSIDILEAAAKAFLIAINIIADKTRE